MVRIRKSRYVVEKLGVQPGQTVLDCGTGTGAYAFAAAEFAGPTRRVYALDIRPELVESINKQATERGLDHLHSIHRDLDTSSGLGITERLADAAIVANVLFQLHDRPGFLSALRASLADHASVLVVDWSGSHSGVGPKQAHVIPEEQARELCELNGFTTGASVDAGEYKYAFFMSPTLDQDHV